MRREVIGELWGLSWSFIEEKNKNTKQFIISKLVTVILHTNYSENTYFVLLLSLLSFTMLCFKNRLQIELIRCREPRFPIPAKRDRDGEAWFPLGFSRILSNLMESDSVFLMRSWAIGIGSLLCDVIFYPIFRGLSTVLLLIYMCGR